MIDIKSIKQDSNTENENQFEKIRFCKYSSDAIVWLTIIKSTSRCLVMGGGGYMTCYNLKLEF